MKPDSFLAGLLLGVVVGLTPVAYAFPPDPSWLPGFYDDDYDDVIAKVSSGVATVSVPLYEAEPIVIPIARLALGSDRSPFVLPAFSYLTRGPPSS